MEMQLTEQLILAAYDVSDKIQKIKEASLNYRRGAKQGFNFFKAMVNDKTHYEKYHTSFIGYLLNPTESHDCESFFLENFLNIEPIQNYLNGKQIEKTRFDRTTLDNVKVRIERNIPTNGRKIDLTVESQKDWILFVENKVRNDEGGDQLQDYYNFSKSFGYARIGIFLTPTGRKPESITDTDKKEIISLSYKNDIIPWIQKCIDGLISYLNIVSILKQYIDIVNKDVINRLEDKKMEPILNYLNQNKKLAKILIANKPDLLNALDAFAKSVRKNFFIQLRQKVKDTFNEKLTELEIIDFDENDRLLCKYKTINFYFEIDDWEEPNNGSWWGIKDMSIKGIECGLEGKNWEGVIFNGMNDYYNLDKGSSIIIDAMTNTESSNKLIYEIIDSIITRIKETVLFTMKMKYFQENSGFRNTFFVKLKKSLINKLSSGLGDLKLISDFQMDFSVWEYKSSQFKMLIEKENPAGDDGGYGSWWGIQKMDGTGFPCGLKYDGWWEPIYFNDINDFENFLLGSEALLDLETMKSFLIS